MNEIIKGKVVHGKGNGKKFLVPTFNLEYKGELKTDFGVYISEVYFGGNKYIGVTNIGRRPTIDNENKTTVETHIIDFNSDIYGEEVSLVIKDKIRETKKFESIELLKKQIEKDINIVKERGNNNV